MSFSFNSILIITVLLQGRIAWSESYIERFIDKSNSVFLSSELSRKLSSFQSFPVFWWDFLVREVPSDDWSEIEKACDELKAVSAKLVLRVDCQESIGDFHSIVRDWSQDLPLRIQRPND